MSLAERFVHRRDDGIVIQDPVGMVHPILTQIGDFLGDPMIRKLQLCPPHLNHGASSRGGARWGRGAANRD